MSLGKTFLAEFDHEMATTRRVLERIPDDKLAWKAHPKSNTIGWVGCHLAEIPGWVAGTLAADEWDLAPPGGPEYKTPTASSRQEILAAFDKNVAEARAALATAADAEFGKMWSLKRGGQTLFSMPKAAVVRTWVINHTVHHRAALCVYLRLNDVPVPSVYGPSGDEGGM